MDRFTADGIMALFGASVTHEDHASRARVAALHIGEVVDEYATGFCRSQAFNSLTDIIFRPKQG